MKRATVTCAGALLAVILAPASALAQVCEIPLSGTCQLEPRRRVEITENCSDGPVPGEGSLACSCSALSAPCFGPATSTDRGCPPLVCGTPGVCDDDCWKVVGNGCLGFRSEPTWSGATSCEPLEVPDCLLSPTRCVCGTNAGNGPVLAATGAMYLEPVEDFRAAGLPGGALVLSRIYSSSAAQRSNEPGDLGAGWAHSFSDRLLFGSSGTTWLRSSGARVRFPGSCEAAPCSYEKALSSDHRLVRAGADRYELIEEGGERRLTFDGAGRLRSVASLVPGGFRDFLELTYYESGAAEAACATPTSGVGDGRLCQISAPSGIAERPYATLHVRYERKRHLCGHADVIAAVTGADGSPVAEYSYEEAPASCAVSCDPSCPAVRLRSAGAGDEVWNYEYELSRPETPLLSAVLRPTGDVAERHVYAAVDQACSTGADCPSQLCAEGVCAGHRRVLESATDCSSADRNDCAQTLRFHYAWGETEIEDPVLGRAWAVTHELDRVTGASSECGCSGDRSYAWTPDPTGAEGRDIRRRRLTASLDSVASSVGFTRYTTYSYEAGGEASMQPTRIIEGDDDADPGTVPPEGSGALRRELRYDHPLGLLTAESADGALGGMRHSIFDFGTGPLDPVSCASEPADFNHGALQALPRRRIEIGRTATDTAGSIGCSIRITSLAYDAMGRLLAEDGPLPGAVDRVGYEYYPDDAPGDDAGRLRRVLRSFYGGSFRLAVEHSTYTRRGQAGRVTVAHRPGEANPPATVSTFDPATGRLLSELQPGLVYATESVYRRGRLETRTAPDGSVEVQGYVPGLDLLERVERRNPAGELIESTKFEYDPATHLLAFVRSSHAEASGEILDRVEEYRYDKQRRQVAVARYRVSDHRPAALRVTHQNVGGLVDWIADENHARVGAPATCSLDTSRACVAPGGGACPDGDQCLHANIHNVHDARGRLAEVWRKDDTGAFVRVARHTYDRAGNLASVEDGLGRVSSFEHDDFGAVLSVTTPESGRTSFDYDETGRLRQSQPSHLTAPVEHRFDGMGRSKEETYSQDWFTSTVYGDELAPETIELPMGECGTGAVLPVEHVAGRAFQVTHQSSSLFPPMVTYYGYTPRGDVAYEAVARPGDACVTVVRRDHDERGRLRALAYPTGRTADYLFSGPDPRYPGEVATTFRAASATLAADVRFVEGQLASYTAGNGLAMSRETFLDGTPRRVAAVGSTGAGFTDLSATQTRGDGAPLEIADAITPGLGQRFGYDAFDRLTSAYVVAEDPARAYCAEAIAYVGPSGDRRTHALATAACEEGLLPAGTPVDEYSYWPEGSVLSGRSDGPVRYCDGAIERLPDGEWGECIRRPGGAIEAVEWTLPDGSKSRLLISYGMSLRTDKLVHDGPLWYYAYDHQNRRIRKISPANARPTDFTYGAAGELLAEKGFGSVTSLYPRPLREYVHLGDQPIAILPSSVASDGSIEDAVDGPYFVHADLIGAPVQLTNASAIPVWRTQREPFGAARVVPSTVILPLGSGAPETAHPYAADLDSTWRVDRPDGATAFALHFIEFEVEDCADFVTVEAPDGEVLARYTGHGPAATGGGAGGQAPRARGDFTTSPFALDHVIVRLRSDESDCISRDCGAGSTCAADGGTCRKRPECRPRRGRGTGVSYFGFKLPEVQATFPPRTVLNLRLPGQYADAESGLFYNWHRYYDPQTGRYLTPDPLLSAPAAPELAQGDSAYVYTGANPLSFVDPTGLVRYSVSCPEAPDGSGRFEIDFDQEGERMTPRERERACSSCAYWTRLVRRADWRRCYNNLSQFCLNFCGLFSCGPRLPRL